VFVPAPREALVLSVRPPFATRILDGTKTVELRRVRPSVRIGQDILIYGTSPTMALLGSSTVERVETGPVQGMWSQVRHDAGISKSDYERYFTGADVAVALWLGRVTTFEEPIPLHRIRSRWPWFRPPQSYCFVSATFEDTGGIASLMRRASLFAPT